jgi:twitching motility protein PilT
MGGLQGGWVVSDKLVLIVHDDQTFTDQLKAGLQAAAPGVQVAVAISAPRALGMIGQATPAAIVVEAELEGLDGYALTQQLRGDAGTQNVPVVIVTPAPNESSALRARQAGAAAHMSSTGPIEPLVGKVAALAMMGAAPKPAGGVPAPGVMPAAPGAAAPGGPPAPQSVASSMGAPAAPQPAAPAGYGAPQPVGAAPAGYGAPQPAPQVAPVPAPPSGSVEVAPGGDTPHIDDLLRIMLDRGGSDLHVAVGSPPGIRQRGEIIPLEDMKPLSPRDTMEMIFSLLSEEQRRRFETELELDFAYSIPGVSRFRANVFQQRNSLGAVFRVIPIKIPTLEDLSLPKVCRFLAERPRGLVLVTGPTGSGKSTTLAAMIDHINATRALHIITMEDPIEFMHRNKKSYVNQREIGEDTHSFASALKRVLRQDPDVILVGEMRDLETISAAITAAETGHLVLATLHTTGGPETIDRIIDVFPPHQQQQVRMQLSGSLEGVLSQVLLRSTDGRTRTMAMEIMLGIPAICNLIREGKTHQMETIIQGGASLGMQTLDQHLKVLLTQGKITFEEAIAKAKNPRELANMLGRKI